MRHVREGLPRRRNRLPAGAQAPHDEVSVIGASIAASPSSRAGGFPDGSAPSRGKARALLTDGHGVNSDLQAHPFHDSLAGGHMDGRAESQGRVKTIADQSPSDDRINPTLPSLLRRRRQHQPDGTEGFFQGGPDPYRIGPLDDDLESGDNFGTLSDGAGAPTLRRMGRTDPLLHLRGPPDPGRFGNGGFLPARHAAGNEDGGVNPCMKSCDGRRDGPLHSYRNNGWAGRRFPW
jgi:hypothetical protein